MYNYYTYLITFKKYYVIIMFLLRILLLFFIFFNVNFLYSSDKLKNIRFSDNYQDKSLRIVLDLTHNAAYTVFFK